MIVNLPTTQDVLLVHAGDDPGIVINRDLTQLVYFGDHPAFVTPGEASVIDALTFTNYSGDVDLYAHSGGPNFCQVDVQPNCTNWSPSPAQSALSIAASGIMLDATGQSILTSQATLAAQNAQNTLIPANISALGIPSTLPVNLFNGVSTGAGVSWNLNGGATIPFTVGGAYELVLLGGTNTTTFVTDLLINHVDVNGIQTYSESLTVSNWIGGTGGFGVIVRGNLHGVGIRVSGQSAAQAFITALYPSNPTVTNFTPYLYAIPYASTPTPKVIPYQMLGLLRMETNKALAAGGSNSEGPLASYCGPVIGMMYNPTGAGFAPLGIIRSYQVASGSSSIQNETFIPWSGSAQEPTLNELALDTMFHVLIVSNVSATVAGNYALSLTALEYI